MIKVSTTKEIKHFVVEGSMTLADHAEAWHREQGKVVPERNTDAYIEMYEEWARHAFKNL